MDRSRLAAPDRLMTDLPRRLRLLDAMIDNLMQQGGEPMLLSQLDGFVAGLVVSPELIPPEEWLPLAWDVEAGEGASDFGASGPSAGFVSLVMEHYNATAVDLSAGNWAPLFDVDERHDETLWEIWIEGFELAASLRRESWGRIIEGDEDGALAFSGLIQLSEIANQESELTKDQIAALTKEAPDLIAFWLGVLHAASPRPSFVTPDQGAQGPPKRPLPLRLRPEIQDVLRAELMLTPPLCVG